MHDDLLRPEHARALDGEEEDVLLGANVHQPRFPQLLRLLQALAVVRARLRGVDLDEPAAVRVCAAIEAAGGQSIALACDVSDESDVPAAIEAAADQLGGLDVLVNNAGIVKIQPFDQMSLEDWDRTFAVNLRSMFLTCRAALPHLRASSAGAIVNIASMAALRYTVPHVDYAATKGGVVSFTRDLAFELGGDGIRVNAVSAGPIRTLAASGIGSFSDILEIGRSRSPLRRNVEAAEVGDATTFLLSDLSRGVTGCVLFVDGGFHITAL